MTDNMHAWKDDEYGYCARLVAFKGDRNVDKAPCAIAAYLRLQASQAYRDGEYELSARLGYAATCIFPPEASKGENDRTDQVLFDNFNDALIAAHRYSRMVKCGACGYTTRVTRKWLNQGSPICPCNHKAMREV